MPGFIIRKTASRNKLGAKVSKGKTDYACEGWETSFPGLVRFCVKREILAEMRKAKQEAVPALLDEKTVLSHTIYFLRFALIVAVVFTHSLLYSRIWQEAEKPCPKPFSALFVLERGCSSVLSLLAAVFDFAWRNSRFQMRVGIYGA